MRTTLPPWGMHADEEIKKAKPSGIPSIIFPVVEIYPTADTKHVQRDDATLLLLL